MSRHVERRIHTRVVIDMATGRVEQDDFHWYAGPLARCNEDDGGPTDSEGNRVGFASSPGSGPGRVEVFTPTPLGPLASDPFGGAETTFIPRTVAEDNPFITTPSGPLNFALNLGRARDELAAGGSIGPRPGSGVPDTKDSATDNAAGSASTGAAAVGSPAGTTTAASTAAASGGVRGEADLLDLQVQLAEQQLRFIKDQFEFQQGAFEEFAPLLQLQADEAQRQIDRAKQLEPITDELLQLELDSIRRGGRATPEQEALIEEIGQAALARGEIDIERFQTEATQRLTDELANSLGLRASDTPITLRGQDIVAESVRQQGQLAQVLREAEANAKLNFPLAQQQITSGQTQFQQSLAQSAEAFSAQLRDAAFNNRLRLTGTQGGLGISLAGAATPTAGFAPRQPAPIPEQPSNSLGLGGLLTAAGGFLGGLGAIGFSHPSLKTDIRQVDVDRMLAAVVNTPAHHWRYRSDEAGHVGPMADAVAENTGVGDGVTLDLLDMIGVLWAATQALVGRLEEMESNIDEIEFDAGK